ncbi:MAG: hypothetical protein Q9191_003863 [Dirinaria sp. TL-2023a]
MNFTGLADLTSQSSSPTQPNGDSEAAAKTPQPDETPTKQSANILRFSSPTSSDADGLLSHTQLSSQPGTPTSESGGPAWSAAVGRASLGKSGRVIDRLMGENDRLRREQTLTTLKLEEEVKRRESARSALETLRNRNEHLEFEHEHEETTRKKTDLKITDMKADLEAERSRRANAEAEARITRREAQESVDKHKKQAMDALDAQRQATTQYDVLAKAMKNMEEGYKRQIQKLRSDVKAHNDEIAKEKQTVSHHKVITEQMKRELDKSVATNSKLMSIFEAYKTEQARSLKDIKERAERNGTAHEEVLKEIESVLGQMRYVINVKRDVKDAE